MLALEQNLHSLAFAAYFLAAVLFLLRLWIRRDDLPGFGFLLTAAALLLQTEALAARTAAAGRLPFSSFYEFLTLFAWGSALVFLFMFRRYRIAEAGVLILPLIVGILGYASLLSKDIQPLLPALQSFWLQLHVLTAIFAYGAFAVSFALAVLYLASEESRGATSGRGTGEKLPKPAGDRHSAADRARENQNPVGDKERPNEGKGPFAWLLPAPPVLDRLIYGTAAFGFTFLTLVIVTGAVWAEKVWGRWWGWDPKETWAFITWLIYLFYLHAHLNLGWCGRRGAWLACLGFAAVLFTLIGVTYLLPGLHSY